MKYKVKRAIDILSQDGPLKVIDRITGYIKINYYVKNNSVDNDELEAICDRIWYYEKEGEIAYSASANEDIPVEFSQYSSHYQPDQPFICEVPSGYLVGPAATGFSNDGRLILETVGGNIDNLVSRYSNFFGERGPRELFVEFERESPQTDYQSYSQVFPLVSSYDRYYYHWITIYLTRLRMLEQYEQLTDNKPVVLIESDPPTFVTETLALLGYGPERVIEWHGGKQKINNLVVSNHRIQNGVIGLYQHSRQDYTWLREKIRSAISSGSKFENGRKIYISRQEADTGRKVINYDMLTSRLESYGFESVVLESLPIQRQFEILVGADMIIGPHGAGLANMIFADDPVIIELLPESHIKPSFYMISKTMGFEYRCVICESRDNDDMIVDVDELSDILDEYITRHS